MPVAAFLDDRAVVDDGDPSFGAQHRDRRASSLGIPNVFGLFGKVAQRSTDPATTPSQAFPTRAPVAFPIFA
ncbi:hypothetical protein Val02_72760 [Virgisporangium aliadipatigenens]|uniref:Uncharacterized protein n=1 Tax=Virgisporangium aliadipatigenens TaxID=741659 RepID=A0A8J3YV47_9ACTN|nr:hypothetical protein Val02_72760 [Virgisporangium aliadipatigenens]